MTHVSRARHSLSGFTLTELVTATAILGIVIGGVWSALIAILSSSQAAEQEYDRKVELNRAADYMADDIQNAAKISGTVTLSGVNSGVFELTKADGKRVAYFVRKKGGSPWKGPYVLYRRSSDMSKSQALVDGLSSHSPICLAGGGSVKQKAGFKVSILSERHMKLCLAGKLLEDEVLTVSRIVSVRNSS